MKRDKLTTISLEDTDLFRNANYIDGEWIAADNGAVMEVHNPSSGALVGTVPAMGVAETRKAIAAAWDVREAVTESTNISSSNTWRSADCERVLAPLRLFNICVAWAEPALPPGHPHSSYPWNRS